MGTKLKPQGHPDPSTRGHERRDARAGWIFLIVFLLGLGGIATHIFVKWWLAGLERTPAPADSWLSSRKGSIAATNSFPRLQISPPADLRQFRAGEEAELNSYGWVNRSSGVVRIPIDRAMELLARQGLPVRTGSNVLGPSLYELQQRRPESSEPHPERPM